MLKKKYWSIFGAVVAVVLMVSSASAVNFVNVKKMKIVSQINNDSTKNKVYIDPNICLTKKQLPLLKKAISEIKDPTNQKIVQSIIAAVEEKGIVRQSEIKEIVSNLNANILGIHCGFVHGNGDGDAFLIRGPIQLLIFFVEQAILLASYPEFRT